MTELRPNERVDIVGGTSATIVKELGRGGQGIVYLVDYQGVQKALKWYLNPPEQSFYLNLKDNIVSGAPSPAFLWPEALTEQQRGSYGYIMALRPQGYYEFSQFLLARQQFASFEAMLAAAIKICDGFRMLHLFGYSYQDLNDGNFFINPQTGDVLICDNDNVMPQGDRSGIMGKARYMAPEVVGGAAPDKYSDRYSLSVILFMLFYVSHPLEGARVLACPCLTEAYERQFYGSEALFIYDPADASNRPVRGIHENAIRRWPVLPQLLRSTFEREFSQEVLRTPQRRMIEQEWVKVLCRVRDGLVRCPHCGEETFVVDDAPKCMSCQKAIDVSRRLVIGARRLPLTAGSRIYIDTDNTADAVVELDKASNMLLLRNATQQTTWTAETPSGKIKQVRPSELMPVKNGIHVAFSPSIKGEIQA